MWGSKAQFLGKVSRLILLAYVADLASSDENIFDPKNRLSYDPANCVFHIFCSEGFVCLENYVEGPPIIKAVQQMSKVYECPATSKEPCLISMEINQELDEKINSTRFTSLSSYISPVLVKKYLGERPKVSPKVARWTDVGHRVDCEVPPGAKGWLTQNPVFNLFRVTARDSCEFEGEPFESRWNYTVELPVVTLKGINVAEPHCHDTSTKHL